MIQELLNLIGATMRWTYGSIWKSIFKKPKFTFDEYINGPKDSSDYFDQTGHGFVNVLIGLFVLAVFGTIFFNI